MGTAAASAARNEIKMERRRKKVIGWTENIRQEEASNGNRIGFLTKARRTTGNEAIKVETRKR